MEETCTMTAGKYTLVENYYPCGKTAKWKNPENQHPMFLCGIHRNSLDKMYKRINSDLRCLPFNSQKEGG